MRKIIQIRPVEGMSTLLYALWLEEHLASRLGRRRRRKIGGWRRAQPCSELLG